MSRPNINFEHKRLELIQIAFKLFMEKGYENTTVNDILKASGISKGAMYHYFDKKEDILDAVLNYVIDIDEKRYEFILDNSDMSAIKKIAEILKASDNEIPQEVIQARSQMSIRAVSIFDYRSRDLSNKRSVEMFLKIIKEGIESGEFDTIYPEETAEMVVSFMQSIYERITEEPSLKKVNNEVDYFIFILSKSLKIEESEIEEIRNLLKKQLVDVFKIF